MADETGGEVTRVEAIAVYFKVRPNIWIDGRELADVAGAYAWRTRISELRKAPFLMNIENRQTRISRPYGAPYVLSEYRYIVPTVTVHELASREVRTQRLF